MKEKFIASLRNKIDSPEFMLYMVITFMLWTIGFVDLLASTANPEQKTFLGPYTQLVIMLLGAYIPLFFIWLGVILIPNSLQWIRKTLTWAQGNNWLAMALIAPVFVGIWHLIAWPDWHQFSGASTVLMVWLILTGFIIIFVDLGANQKTLFWRKAVVSVLAIVLIVEAIAQGVAYFGLLPGRVYLDGAYVKYGRIYQNEEGLGNGRLNNYGRYAPDFAFAEDTKKIALMGDTFIQAYQIQPEQHMSVHLQEQLTNTEVYPLGHAGFGPSLYLESEILEATQRNLGIEEMVIFIHLSNDLRHLAEPIAEPDLAYKLRNNGQPAVIAEDFDRWHDVGHYTLIPYKQLNPIRIAETHYLSDDLIRGLLGTGTAGQNTAEASTEAPSPYDIPGVHGNILSVSKEKSFHTLVNGMDLLDTTGYSNFLFIKDGNEQADEAHIFTEAFIQDAISFEEESGVKIHIVTIPAFPPAFYTEFGDGPWNPELGEYNLFLPEQRLQTFAEQEGIPFLAMGQYMMESGLSAADIQDLFFNEGTGHLTPAGHQFFADTTHECFYSADSPSSAACMINN